MFEDIIRYWAEATPENPAFVLPSGRIGFRDFHRSIIAASNALRSGGLTEGARVLISDSRPFYHWVAFFALDRVGCVSISEDNMGFTAGIPDIDCVVTNGGFSSRAVNVISTAGDWLAKALRDTKQDSIPARTSSSDAVRVLLSSGTTGRPKQSQFTRKVIDLRATRRAYLRPNDQTRFATAMGINTAGGFITPIATWLSGGSVVYGSDRGGLAEAVQMGANFLFLSPNQLQQLLRSTPGSTPNGALRVLIAGGRLPGPLADQARATLTPRLELLYGSTEVGYVTRAYRTGSGVPDGYAGHVHPWAQLQVVGADDQVLPAGYEGLIRVRSDEMVGSYLGSAALESAGYRDGWHYPGDLGIMQRDGSLVVSGRTNEVINVGGVKLALAQLEEQLLLPGVLDAAVTSLPTATGTDELIAAIVTESGATLEPVFVRARALSRTQVRVVQVAKIPRNDMGKVMRTELKALVALRSSIISQVPPLHQEATGDTR